MKTAVILCVVFLVAAVNAGNLADTVGPCTDGSQTPDKIFVDGCDAFPCEVRNGDTVWVEIVFNAPRATTTLTPRPSLTIGAFEIPFVLPEEDRIGCNSLIEGTRCPVAEGDRLHYRLGMLVDTPILGITVNIVFSLVDDSGLNQVCYTYAQTIVA